MSSFYSVSGSGNNLFNMFFNTSNTSNSSNTASGLFSGGSSMLGDYALIRSGSYKKLLTAYYDMDKSDEKSSKTGTKKEVSDSTGSLQSAKSDASALMDSLSNLGKKSLYKADKDEEGNTVYDTDKINSAVKKYVESYNSFIDSTGDLSSTSMLSKTLNVVKSTAKNAGLLSDIGITIGSDNKLKLDEEKLKKADVNKISSLFVGSGSYGSSVSTKAAESYRIANSAAYSNTHASSYTYNGTYSLLGTGSTTSLDKYL